MISREVADMAENLVRQNDWAQVNAVPSSFIGELSTLSRHPFAEQAIQVDEKAGESRIVEEIVQATQLQEPGMSLTHDVRESEVVQQIVPILNARMSTLRDKIIPIVEDVASRLNSRLENSVPETWEVIPLPFAQLYRSKAFAELLEQYRPALVRDASTLSGLSDRTEDEIVKLVDTGNTALNEMVVEIVAKYPTDWLKGIYDKYFRAGLPERINTRFNPFTGFAYLDEFIIVHLLARTIQLREIVDAGVNMPKHEYDMALVNLIVATGSTINRCLGQIIDFHNAKQVIVNIDHPARKIFVLDENYETFLSEGGTADAVIGAVILRVMSEPYPSLLQQKETLEKASQQAYQEQLDNLERLFIPRVRENLPSVIRDVFGTQPSEVLALFNHPIDTENAKAGDILSQATLNTFANSLAQYVEQASKGKDIRAIVRFIIVDVAAPTTGFARILDTIESVVAQARQAGVTMSVREAAYYAVVDEIANYLVDNNLVSASGQLKIK